MNAQNLPSIPGSALPDYLAPVFAQFPLAVESAEGVWLHTSDGRRVLDLYGGHAVAALGYGHPGWTRALSEQARILNFQSNAVPLDVRLRAAARLIRFSDLGFSSVFFVNSGAEANENALKMAFAITGRSHVAAIEHSFHGRTAAAGAISRPLRPRLPAQPPLSSSSRCRAWAVLMTWARHFCRRCASAVTQSARC